MDVVLMVEVLDERMKIDFSLFMRCCEVNVVEKWNENGLIGSEDGLRLEFFEEGDTDSDWMVAVSQ